MNIRDPFAPRAADPKNATKQVQSSLWRNLRHLYPNLGQAGEVAWVLIRAGRGERADLAILRARKPSELQALIVVAQKTKDSPAGSDNESWAQVSAGIVQALRVLNHSETNVTSLDTGAGAGLRASAFTPEILAKHARDTARVQELVAGGLSEDEAMDALERENGRAV